MLTFFVLCRLFLSFVDNLIWKNKNIVRGNEHSEMLLFVNNFLFPTVLTANKKRSRFNKMYEL